MVSARDSGLSVGGGDGWGCTHTGWRSEPHLNLKISLVMDVELILIFLEHHHPLSSHVELFKNIAREQEQAFSFFHVERSMTTEYSAAYISG